MRIVLQRVCRASVRVDGIEVSRIERGFLLLVGIEVGDTQAEAVVAAKKLRSLRIFPDPRGRMNRDLGEIGGRVLVVSQFTLAASTSRGNRPSFSTAAPSTEARAILSSLVAELEGHGLSVEQGAFGADMQVELLNDGPVTFVLEFRSDGSRG